MARRKLTTEQKYEIADKLAAAYASAGATPAIVNESRSYYFGSIVNQAVTVKGKTVKLSDAYGEDDAIHITNLVIRRLCQVRAEMVGTVAL